MSSRGTTPTFKCSASLKGSNGGPDQPACIASRATDEARALIRSIGSPSLAKAITEGCVQNLLRFVTDDFSIKRLCSNSIAISTGFNNAKQLHDHAMRTDFRVGSAMATRHRYNSTIWLPLVLPARSRAANVSTSSKSASSAARSNVGKSASMEVRSQAENSSRRPQKRFSNASRNSPSRTSQPIVTGNANRFCAQPCGNLLNPALGFNASHSNRTSDPCRRGA